MIRCKDDDMVIIDYGDSGISPEDKKKIESHMQECESCREKWKSLQRMKRIGSKISKEKFVTQTCGKEHLDLLVDGNEIIRSVTTIAAGGVNSNSGKSGKVAATDNDVRESVLTIAGGDISQKDVFDNVAPKIPVARLEPVAKDNQQERFTPLKQEKVHKKYSICILSSFDTSSEYAESLEAYSERCTSKIAEYLAEKNHKIISCYCNKEKGSIETRDVDILLQYRLEFGFRLDISVAKIKDDKIKNDCLWAGSKATMYEDIERDIENVLEWLLSRD